MRIRVKIFLGVVLAVAPAFWFLVNWVIDDLTPQYRKSTEEPLVDAAYVLASIAAASVEDGEVDVELFREGIELAYAATISAQIYKFTKHSVDFRLYITDSQGIVIFDSFNELAVGEDYSEWRDVNRTLKGEYGARTSRDIQINPMSSIMYVAAPIISQGEIIGVLSVGKPTTNANQFIEEATKEITLVGTVSAVSALAVALLISGMITRPIRRLEDYAAAIRDGQRTSLPKISGPELQSLANTFESMRETLEGKKYVEHYVQTLTHEVKGPLSAIRGACELLTESPPPDKQEQFLRNIQNESARIQDIIEALLQLSQLEAKRQLDDRRRISLPELVEEIIESFSAVAAAKQIAITLESSEDCHCLGDRFLLRQAISNLIKNAIEFSPVSGNIQCLIRREGNYAMIEVLDEGPGIPSYAESRVFERFYSLQRPDTGRKSSGLGLSLALEVAQMHQGALSIENVTNKGAKAQLSLPVLGNASD